MGEEKIRVSGELSRPADAPILPTVNPAAEKSEPSAAGIHPVFFVMFVNPPPRMGKCEQLLIHCTEYGFLSVLASFSSTNGSYPPSNSVCVKTQIARTPRLTILRLSYSAYSMASCIRDYMYTNPGPYYKTA
jgi:hypothetical protein